METVGTPPTLSVSPFNTKEFLISSTLCLGKG